MLQALRRHAVDNRLLTKFKERSYIVITACPVPSVGGDGADDGGDGELGKDDADVVLAALVANLVLSDPNPLDCY